MRSFSALEFSLRPQPNAHVASALSLEYMEWPRSKAASLSQRYSELCVHEDSHSDGDSCLASPRGSMTKIIIMNILPLIQLSEDKG